MRHDVALTEQNRNLFVRVATAVVMVPVLLAMLFSWPKGVFYGLVLVATLVGAIELFGMTHPGDRASQAVLSAVSLGVSLALYFFGDDARVLLGVLSAVPVVAILLPLARLGAIETAALRVAAGGFGPIYLGMLTLLARLHVERGDDGGGWVLFCLFASWLSDTGGYFAGRFLGKHKLYPAVSPKKTVEGAIGGLVGAAAGAVITCLVTLKSLPLAHGIALAVVAGGLGQLGDLGESLLKRSTGVKDSGQIVPGHGGILDRVDALLIVAPVVYAFTKVMLP